MRALIPSYVIATLSEVVPRSETHDTLERLFTYAGAPGEPPLGSKPTKVTEWLRRVNKDQSLDPLQILGRLIEDYMEFQPSLDETSRAWQLERCQQIEAALARASFSYCRGGRVSQGLALPTRTLEALIRDRDLESLHVEFDRAVKNIETSPREAVSAACNLLESVCKVYIEDEGLSMPPRQDLAGVWGVVRKHLGFDPSVLQDDDLKSILAGLFAIVAGVGAFRTHASSAHGTGRTAYKVQPRHARLAVHAAHTVAAFVLETWEARKVKAEVALTGQ